MKLLLPPPNLPDGYQLCAGTTQNRALLVRFLQLTYQELFPQQPSFSHLAATVEQYFAQQTPLWWVVPSPQDLHPIACLWLGTAIDQVSGDRYAHIFLLYVTPQHRCHGIATALIEQAQHWAIARGDRQLGLHVFDNNLSALNLYQRLGFQTQSRLMLKSLGE